MKKFLQKASLLLAVNALIFNGLSAQNPEVKPFSGEPRSVSFGGLRARSIGPAVMSGRVADVEGVASKPEILYIGGANGGVWKSTNGGASFRPVFDEHPQAIGKIRVDPQHPDTVWVGTGEPWVRNSVGIGTGIYVSKNGGSTWELRGLPNSERIANIQIDPTNSNVIYVAVQGALWSDSAERGVYKSSDFGKTWEKILYVDEKTGCAELVMDAKDPSVLYAAMWQHRRRADFFDSGGKSSALYKTADGGKTWAKMGGAGFPTSTLGRIGIAVAPSNSKVLYASFETEKKEEKGIYKSADGGATWKLINSDFNTTVRPFYFSRINVDPNNENTFIKAGLTAIISNDGGNSFRDVSRSVHGDMHAFWYNPKNSKNMIIGTDGGAYITQDGGYSWTMCKDLPLSQFYHVSTDNDEPYNVYGGLQDNNSWYGPNENNGGVKNADWVATSGGDGFYAFRHPTNKNIVFSESQGGDISRFDKSTDISKDIKPIAKIGDAEYRWNWNTPIALSPTNPNRMYMSSQFLFATDDMGDSWRRISPDLTTNNPKLQDKKSGGFSPDWSGAETNTTIVQITESPLDANQIWCGTDDGNLQMTADGGKTWANVTKNLAGVPSGLWISSVEPSHFNKNTCFVTVDGHRSGNMKPYVLRTSDAGKSWTPLNTEGVESYIHCLVEDPKNADLLYLGTEFGLFISIDGGRSFKRFANNLPKTAVMKMVIQPKDNDLVIATHGRGIYILDDLTPLRLLTKEVLEKDFHLFDTKPKIYTFRKATGGSGYGTGNFAGENPSTNIQIIYYQKKRHTFGDMKVEIFDAGGKLMSVAAAGKQAGINIVDVSPMLPFPKQAPTSNIEALGRGAFPPQLPEGVYTFKITKGEQVYNGSFEVKYPDDCPIPVAERKQQQAATKRVYGLVNELGYYFYQQRAMHEQAGKLSKEVASDKKLAKQLDDFSADLKKHNASLTTLDGDFYIAAGEHLREELSRLYSAIASYPGKPAEHQMERLVYFEGELAKVKAKFDAYSAQMAKFNESLTKAGKSPIKIKTLADYLAGK